MTSVIVTDADNAGAPAQILVGRDGVQPPPYTPDLAVLCNAARYRMGRESVPGTASRPSTASLAKPSTTSRRLSRHRSTGHERVTSAMTSTSRCRSSDIGEDDFYTTHSTTTESDFFFDINVEKNVFDDDFDEEDENQQSKSRFQCVETHSQRVYRAACRQAKQTPSAMFVKGLKKESVDMKHHNLGAAGVKPCCVALMVNDRVNKFDLSDNDIKAKGAGYISEMLTENVFLTELILADNNIGKEGGKLLCEVLKDNEFIRLLDVSGNGFEENDAAYFAELLKENFTMRELILSHNAFREVGGCILAPAIEANDTLETLDLSWNHLRRRGAVAIANGLKENTSLRKVDLSWNGFHIDGSEAVGKALQHNTTLQELSLATNRIDLESLSNLISGLKHNNTIKKLDLGHNPITTEGATLFMTLLSDGHCTDLTEVDLSGQSIDIAFTQLVEKVRNERTLTLRHGRLVRQDMVGEEITEEFFLNDDPVVVLMEFMRLKNLRLVDLFCSLDKDSSWTLTRNEFREGLLMANIPLSSSSLDRLMEKLDTNRDTLVDFSELVAGQKEHKRKVYRVMQQAREEGIPFISTSLGHVSRKIQAVMSYGHMKAISDREQQIQKELRQLVSDCEKGGGRNATRIVNSAPRSLTGSTNNLVERAKPGRASSANRRGSSAKRYN